MNKKRIFGIILFILIGFFMFTFANPNEKVEDEKGKTNTEEKAKKEKKGIQVIEPTEKEKDLNVDTTDVRVETNRVVPTENNIPVVTPIDNSKEIEANLKLEAAKKAAREELESYRIEYEYNDKTAREVIVNEYIKAINESKDITDVDRLLKDAESKIDELLLADLKDYINNAIKSIEDYAKEDEEYVSEIIDEKETAIKKLNEIKETDLKDIDLKNIKNEIEKIVEVTNGNINDIIASKTFKVTFVGKNNVKEEQTVKYKEKAQVPTTDKFNNPVYKDVTYELTEFDKDISEVKSDLTVNALYKITNIKATIYLNNGDMPSNKYSNSGIKYTKIGTVNLKIDNEKINDSILKDKNANIYTSDDVVITDLFNENPDYNDKSVLGTYDYYEFYSVKFVSGSQAGIHIDCVKLHDSLKELNDAKDRLNDLISNAENLNKEGKTNSSIERLNNIIATARENLKSNNLELINESINALSNASLEDIKVSGISVVNNREYYVVGQKFDLTVTYTDNNGNVNAKTNDYTTTQIDYTIGYHKAYVTYEGITQEFSYNIIKPDQKQFELKVTNNKEKEKYIIGDKADITVVLVNKITSEEYVLSEKDYRVDNFTTSSKKGNTTATVVLLINNNIKGTFNYKVKKDK